MICQNCSAGENVKKLVDGRKALTTFRVRSKNVTDKPKKIVHHLGLLFFYVQKRAGEEGDGSNDLLP